MKTVQRTAVIGAGSMGHGIAQLFAQAGIAVRITDARQAGLVAGMGRIRRNLKALVKLEVLKKREADAAFSLIEPVATIRLAVEGADYVTECVTESMRLKQAVFEELDACTAPNAILASNTSSLSLADIGAQAKRKSRLIVTHYFNPPHIIPIVEVAPASFTDPSVIKTTCALLLRIGKRPVCLKKVLPGFLVNRIQCAIVREVLSILDQGVASAEEIDSAVRGTIGFRLAAVGPLAVMDFGGLDVWHEVLRNVLPSLSGCIEPPEILRQKVKNGDWGVKSGRGFYDWGHGTGASHSVTALRKRDEAYAHLLKLFYTRS